MLVEILPEFNQFEDAIKVIDVPYSYNDACAQLIADARTRKAICYLK
jgi:hypothetical protein